jgi:hypothetical protein
LDGVRDIDVEREIGLGGNNAKRKKDTRQGYWVEGEDRDNVVLDASESSNCVSSLLDRTFLSAITAVSSQAKFWRN